MDRIYTYALVKAFYDSGEEYIDTFLPFAVISMSKSAVPIRLSELQRLVVEEYGMEIPIHALGSIVTRGKNRGLFEIIGRRKHREEQRVSLSTAGQDYIQHLETVRDVQRRLNSLFANLSEFIEKQTGSSISPDQAQALLAEFIEDNLEVAEYYLDSESINLPQKQKIGEYDGHLVSYIKTLENSEPVHFASLQEVVRGSFLSLALTYEDLSKIQKKFKRTTVYLDSNFIFSVLGFHSDVYKKPANELFIMLKSTGFELRVFSITLDEMTNVLRGYNENIYKYSDYIEVDSIYYYLKLHGWTKSKVREFIARIDSHMTDMGIQVEPLLDLDLLSYEPPVDAWRSRISGYKIVRHPVSTNHDLAVIEQIRHMRGEEKRVIEDCDVFFLTSDRGLCRFNYIELGHRDQSTIGETILDQYLSTIMWLKNPVGFSEVPIECLIAHHSRELIVNKLIWDKFFETAIGLNKSGEVTTEDLSILLHDKCLEETLRDYDEADLDNVNTELVITAIEDARSSAEKRHAKELEGKAREIEAAKDVEFNSREKALYDEWSKKVDSVTSQFRKDAESRARSESWWVASLLTALSFEVIVAIIIAVDLLVPHLAIYVVGLIPFFLGGYGMVQFWPWMRGREKDRVYNKVMREKEKTIQPILEDIKYT